MAKLTQKDLIQRSLYEEGIGSMLKQAAKTGLGRIGKTARALRGTGRFLEIGKGLPAGIAVTDMAREIDDGKTFDILKAGAYGYGTGKILNIANKLNILPRVAGLGSFGYLTSGWEADNDERLAAAAVWGVLGVFGPIAEGQPIKRKLTQLESQTKMLMGQMEKPQTAQNKVNELKIEIREAWLSLILFLLPY